MKLPDIFINFIALTFLSTKIIFYNTVPQEIFSKKNLILYYLIQITLQIPAKLTDPFNVNLSSGSIRTLRYVAI